MVFNKNIKKDKRIKKKDLLMVRSQEKGIFASKLEMVLNKKLSKNVKKNENLFLEDLVE